jgi:hypothetical protein
MMNKKTALLAVFFFSLACIFDHLTTVYGMGMPTLSERNPAVLFLMGCGLWHLAEILLIGVGTFAGLFMVRLKSSEVIKLSMKAFTAAGLVRFCVGLQNLVVIANALG